MSDTLDRIGIIGTGNMGAPMVLRLLERGAHVMVCDRNPQATAPLVEHGATMAATPSKLADQVDVVLASMPSYEASLDVVCGPSGVVHGRSIKVYLRARAATTQRPTRCRPQS